MELTIFLFTPTVWGWMLHPYCVTPGLSYYVITGTPVPDDGEAPLQHLQDMAEQLTPEAIFRRFGNRYRRQETFEEKASAELREKIRREHDELLSNILDGAINENYPLYLRVRRKDEIKTGNRLTGDNRPLTPCIGFYKKERGTEYTLRFLNADGEDIVLSRQPVTILSELPGRILVGQHICYLPEGFSARRIVPFLDKDTIVIPPTHEREYFRKFILKNLDNAHLDASGFDIREAWPQPRLELSLEKDAGGKALFTPVFHYDDCEFRTNDNRSSIVLFREDGDQFTFLKIHRDADAEARMLKRLAAAKVKRIGNGHLQPPFDTWPEVQSWIIRVRTRWEKENIYFTQENMEHPLYFGKWRMKQNVREDHDWFDLKIDLVLENGLRIPITALRDYLLKERREYLLPDGSVFMIPDEMFARYSGILFFGRQEKKGHIALQRRQAKGLCPSIIPLPVDHAEGEEAQSVAVPDSLQATLRPYQAEGYRWLYSLYRHRCGACLADDMGLGKTIETIALLLKYKEETKAEAFKTILIVAPAALTHNWRNELQKFAPSLSLLEYKGVEVVRRNRQKTALEKDVIIVSYQTMRNDAGFFTSQEFGVVVLDEAQIFKNRLSQLYRHISQLQADFRISLTGTPIENSLSDLWTQMDVLNPGLLGDYNSFLHEFERPILNNIADIRRQTLQRLVAPYLLRRTKEEVLEDLPPLQRELIVCRMEEGQRRMYEEEVSRFRNLLLEEDAGHLRNSTLVLKGLINIREIANHPALLDHGSTDICRSGKLQQVFSQLENLIGTGHKALIFSDYVSLLAIVAEEMRRREWKYSLLTGDTYDKEKAIADFTQQKDCPFFLISLKAGGVGLNLTQADYVFLLDPWWNTAAEEQAVSRAHRLGQQNPVLVYRFVSENTLEERILRIQDHKDKLVDAIIEGNIPLT